MEYTLELPVQDPNNPRLIKVPDNLIDLKYWDDNSKIGVQLIGQNAINYGTAVAQNTVQMMSNFAGGIVPNDTISLQGQLWFNAVGPTNGSLYVKYNANSTGGIANWRKIVTVDDIGNNNANNIIGGVRGDIPIQNGTTNTGFITAGPNGYILMSTGPLNLPIWQAAPSFTGATGPQGPAGPAGPPGTTGPAGATGPQGPQGPQGFQGPSGAPGAQGASGAAGAIGASGPVGPAGTTGPVGATGPAGAAGAPGPTGATGPTGPAGATGPVGATGPAATGSSNLIRNGYQQFSSGLIMQWGYRNFSTETYSKVFFPIAFPTQILGAQAVLSQIIGYTHNCDQQAQISSLETGSIFIISQGNGGGSWTFPIEVYWFAYGV